MPRVLAFAGAQGNPAKPSEWIKAQPAFLGPQGETAFDPGFDISDGGLPREKLALPTR